MFPNVAYIAASDNKRIIFRIPDRVAVGDKFVVWGRGEGGFKIIFPSYASQQLDLSPIRSIESINHNDMIELRYEPNSTFSSRVIRDSVVTTS